MIFSDSFTRLLSALGNSVLNSFWQMGLLWLGVVFISKYRRNISPTALGNLSFLALVTGFLLFCTTFITSYLTPKTEAGIFTGISDSKILNVVMNYAAVTYLLLLAIPIAKFATGYRQVYNLKRQGLKRAPGVYKIFMLDAKSYLGIKRKVQLWVSEIAEAPLTIGFLKPVILLPVAMLNNLTTTQVEAIILHELAHIKKNDYFINFIGQLIITVLYFNPFAKALLQIHNIEREKLADSRVLQFQYCNHLYASTLLQLAKDNYLSNQKISLQASGQSHQLYNRVKWIMGKKERPAPSTKKLFTSAGFIVMFLLLAPGAKNFQRSSAIGSLMTNSKPAFTFASFRAETKNTTSEKPSQNISERPVSEPSNIKAENTAQKIETPFENPESISTYIFAGTPTVEIPKLTAEQEANVQQSIVAAKKLFAESNWRVIENKLAETVTSEQKAVLKEAFKTRINETDWNNQANILRLDYNNINWEKAKADLDLEVAYIKLDSVYTHYNSALEKYNALRQEITTDKAEEINKKIADTKIILLRADSIRKKRIIEL